MILKILIYLMCIIYAVISYNIDTNEDSLHERNAVCALCSCAEIKPSEETIQHVMNIHCSEARDFPTLNHIVWPENVNQLKISVEFNCLDLKNIEGLPSNKYIESISFDDNSIRTIWPAAFENIEKLKRLSLSNNEITVITPDVFINLDALEELNLSNNKLTEFSDIVFEQLRNLKKLNVHGNALIRMPISSLDKIKALEELDLSKNSIFHIEYDENLALKSLRRLILSGNKLTVLAKDTFSSLKSLELLDISDNEIAHIDDDTLTQCSNLIELNLSNNKLTAIFQLPAKLSIVDLSHNRLQKWFGFPINIKYIDLSYNELINVFDEDLAELSYLEKLFLAGNHLANLQLRTPLQKLNNLDLSYNLLQEIPAALNSVILPNLEEINFSGNPITFIRFNEKVTLRTLYLNNLDFVTRIEDNTFLKVNPLTKENLIEGCFDLYITNCAALSFIAEKAFFGVPLCKLDISYNNLTTIPENLLEWSDIPEGINLQGNPWDCSCNMQWMLDTLLPSLYENHPGYLHELRCATPRARQGLRLVHWYNWGEQALCNDETNFDTDGYMMGESREASLLNLFHSSATITLVLGMSILCIIIIIIGLVVYLTLSRNRSYKIRKAMLNNKRQTLQDTKESNQISREQFVALNTT